MTITATGSTGSTFLLDRMRFHERQHMYRDDDCQQISKRCFYAYPAHPLRIRNQVPAQVRLPGPESAAVQTARKHTAMAHRCPTATGNTGSGFTSWTGSDSTSGSTCTVTMTANRSVGAAFTLGKLYPDCHKDGDRIRHPHSFQVIGCGKTCTRPLLLRYFCDHQPYSEHRLYLLRLDRM